MTDPEQAEQAPEPESITLTADGMILAGTIKYIADRRQIELIKALATAPGEFLSTAEVNDTLEALKFKETSAENLRKSMEGMVRFSKDRFEFKKEDNRLYFRMLGHVSVVDETPSEQ